MKKIYVVTIMVLLCSNSIFAQINHYKYTGRYLGNNLNTSSQLVCTENASTSGFSNTLYISSRNGQNPLELNTLYEFRDENNNIGYTFLLAVSPSSSDDREFWQSRFTKIKPECDLGYEARNFGNILTVAEDLTCSNQPNIKGEPFRFNYAPEGGDELTEEMLYELNDGGQIRYIYVTSKKSTPFTDRDDYDQSSLSAIQITCPDIDNDGIPDNQDNCPNTSNPSQADSDNDGIGNACDSRDNRDFDNDGVQNFEDDCPNEAGPRSNNGCPVSGNPDLTIDKFASQVFSACSRCFPFLDIFFNNGQRHLIAGRNGTRLDFDKLEIRNIGNVTSTAAKVDFYFSTNNTLDTEDDLKVKSVNIPARNSGSAYGIETSINGNDIFPFPANPDSPSTNGNYFILVVVDSENTNNESSNREDNNFLAIPVAYNSSATASSLRFNLSNLSSDNNFLNSSQPYLMKIYNFSGKMITEQEVNDEQEENTIIQNLNKNGIYIIKSKDKTRKVFVGNN